MPEAPTERPTGPVRGLLIDIAGVVIHAGTAIPGAVGAIRRLQDRGLPFRFVTNTTSQPHGRILADLAAIGLTVPSASLFTPVAAARAHLCARGLQAHLLVSPALLPDFADLPPGTNGRAVVVGDARDGFSYAALNDAFRALVDGAELVALAGNRMFLDQAGRPTMDVGAFVAALEYASGRGATVTGKPAPGFFRAAAESMGFDLSEVAMIGDDPEADVAGAIRAGARGVLVQTGKGAFADPARMDPPPDAVFPDLATAIAGLGG